MDVRMLRAPTQLPQPLGSIPSITGYPVVTGQVG
jgi:hypothetical protein